MAGGLGGCWAGESLAFLQRGVTRVHGCLHVTTGLSACSAQGQLPHSSALCWSLSTLILLCLTQGSLSSLFQGRGTGRCFCSSPATGQGGLGGASTLGRETQGRCEGWAWQGPITSQEQSWADRMLFAPFLPPLDQGSGEGARQWGRTSGQTGGIEGAAPFPRCFLPGPGTSTMHPHSSCHLPLAQEAAVYPAGLETCCRLTVLCGQNCGGRSGLVRWGT